jgi:hypothetical protein
MLFGESEESPAITRLRRRIRHCEAVKRWNSFRDRSGAMWTHPSIPKTQPYQKWQGPHWSLYTLAEIGYPPGDRSLVTVSNQFREAMFREQWLLPPCSLLIPGQHDRFRRCAGQEGLVIWYSLKLGIADEKIEQLVERLIKWQWPDGGWNCDKRVEARQSSFHESLIPLRALTLYADLKRCKAARKAADRAAEVFLSRRLFRRASNNTVIHPDFVLLKYPHYYQYNLLFALKVMTEAGYLSDPRCAEALDLLQSKQQPDGGFPLEKCHYRTSATILTNGTFFDFGPRGKRRSNPFVTLDALHILKAAGRVWK